MLARFASQALASGLGRGFQQTAVAATTQRCLHDASSSNQVKATTIICVRKGNEVVVMGDGQVTLGDMIVKPNVRKVRRLGDTAVGGFAGSAADGISLFERLESKLEEHPGQLRRAAVELAKMWRQDKVLRHLQAQMIVADTETTLAITGNGDIIESHDGIMGVGSGSGYAEAAARALMTVEAPDLSAFVIAQKAMKVAGDLCIYTNQVHSWEAINSPDSQAASEKATTP